MSSASWPAISEVVGVLGAALVRAEKERAHAFVLHLHERLEEHLLPLPEGETPRQGDHGDVGRETVLLGLFLEGVLGGDGVGAEEVRVRPAGDAHEARGVGVVRLEDVPAHVFGHADRTQSLEHHAVVRDLEEGGLRAVHAVEGGEPGDAAHLGGPVDAPRRRARAHVHERKALPLHELREPHRVPARREGVLGREGKGEMRHAHGRELLNHGAALRGDRVGDAGLLERVRDLKRAPLHAAHLEGGQNLQNFHAGKYIIISNSLQVSGLMSQVSPASSRLVQGCAGGWEMIYFPP